jgi:hypothetical protein
LEYRGTVVVMDEHGWPHKDEFVRALRREVIFLPRDCSAGELLSLASRAQAYIGSGLGISHLLQTVTNAVIFLGTERVSVWKPYSCVPYREYRMGRVTVEKAVNSIGLFKWAVYAPVWCRPCFDIGCRGRRCIRALEDALETIAAQISKELDVAHRD